MFRSFFFFRTTTEIDLWRDELLRPFDRTVWIALIIFIILISTLIRLAFVIHKKKVERQVASASSFLLTFGAFCQQGNIMVQEIHKSIAQFLSNFEGSHLTPYLFSRRCLFITLFLLSTLIYNF